MSRRHLTRFLLIVVLFQLAAGCQRGSAPSYLVLATTTSVGSSGLLDALLPEWQRATGIEVRVSLAGSGRALRTLEQGQADLVISHAPALEAEVLQRHPRWRYRKLMYTDFVIVGPLGDPSDVASARDVAGAMQRIGAGRATFVSRADQSGTYEREQALWALAGSRPGPDDLLESGAGMATTLRQTSEVEGYTLTDRPTFDRLKKSLQLRIVFEGGADLLNAYAVLVRNGSPGAARLGQWLIDGGGRMIISRFDVEGGRPAYHVWPLERSRDRPDDVPF